MKKILWPVIAAAAPILLILTQNSVTSLVAANVSRFYLSGWHNLLWPSVFAAVDAAFLAAVAFSETSRNLRMGLLAGMVIPVAYQVIDPMRAIQFLPQTVLFVVFYAFVLIRGMRRARTAK